MKNENEYVEELVENMKKIGVIREDEIMVNLERNEEKSNFDEKERREKMVRDLMNEVEDRGGDVGIIEKGEIVGKIEEDDIVREIEWNKKRGK